MNSCSSNGSTESVALAGSAVESDSAAASAPCWSFSWSSSTATFGDVTSSVVLGASESISEAEASADSGSV